MGTKKLCMVPSGSCYISGAWMSKELGGGLKSSYGGCGWGQATTGGGPILIGGVDPCRDDDN